MTCEKKCCQVYCKTCGGNVTSESNYHNWNGPSAKCTCCGYEWMHFMIHTKKYADKPYDKFGQLCDGCYWAFSKYKETHDPIKSDAEKHFEAFMERLSKKEEPVAELKLDVDDGCPLQDGEKPPTDLKTWIQHFLDVMRSFWHK